MVNETGNNRASPTTDPVSEPERKSGFNPTYWLCNVIEMWERLAYYTLRPVAPIYIMQSTEPGGLHLTAGHKGWIYAWWAAFQSLLPMVTGGYADRYGYKLTLFFSITLNIIGYLMMAYMHSYYGFFAGIIILAVGTAFFKPSLQATLGHQLTKANSSLGWGIFYWVVNVGSLLGHYLSPLLLGNPHSADGWRTLFLACAGFTALNYLMLLTFRDVPSGASKTQDPLQVFASTIKHVLEPRLLTWLMIMSCFWLMMYQLWDLQPNYIEDWVDSSMVAACFPDIWPFNAWTEYGDRGLVRVSQQVLISLNAFLIVTLMVVVSWVVRRMRTLSTMFFGMLIATGGVLVAGLTGNGWILLLGIFCFSMGEMLTGPKKNEYLALIAPPGRKGLYLGYVNIPIGVGVFIGSYMAGVIYGHYGEKASLALKHLGAKTELVAAAARSADWSDSLDLVPGILHIERSEAFPLACSDLAQDDESCAETLRETFRYDVGQVVNLGLQYLALDDKYREKAVTNLVDTLAKREGDKQARVVVERLTTGSTTLDQVDLAPFAGDLPGALGVKRPAVLEVLHARINEDLPPQQRRDSTAIVDLLWDRYGSNRETLNNLALEYLAQGTDHVHRAVAAMTFTDPAADIEKRLGIGRTKSFAALCAALATVQKTPDRELLDLDVGSPDAGDRLYTYVMSLPHRRFTAVARHDWPSDIGLLRGIIESDAATKSVVVGALGNESEIDYQKLVRKKLNLIQKALAVKDWSQSPDQAARILGLNPFEARAIAYAEMSRTPISATQLLWDTYLPQYRVWIPFASIGVIAAIALAIFGQLAKRWKDMNA